LGINWKKKVFGVCNTFGLPLGKNCLKEDLEVENPQNTRTRSQGLHNKQTIHEHPKNKNPSTKVASTNTKTNSFMWSIQYIFNINSSLEPPHKQFHFKEVEFNTPKTQILKSSWG
jgi:hypothetical protein